MAPVLDLRDVPATELLLEMILLLVAVLSCVYLVRGLDQPRVDGVHC